MRRCLIPKWGPQRETRQTVREGHMLFLNAPKLDVVARHWVGLEYSLLLHMPCSDGYHLSTDTHWRGFEEGKAAPFCDVSRHS